MNFEYVIVCDNRKYNLYSKEREREREREREEHKEASSLV